MIRRHRWNIVMVVLAAAGTFVLVKSARAADLPIVAPRSFDWAALGIGFVLALVIAGAILFIRHHPSTAAKAKADAQEGYAMANRYATALQEAVQHLAGAAADLTKHLQTVTTPAPAAAPPADVPVLKAEIPAGGNGKAGLVAIQATGDPAVDFAAFQKAYFQVAADPPAA